MFFFSCFMSKECQLGMTTQAKRGMQKSVLKPLMLSWPRLSCKAILLQTCGFMAVRAREDLHELGLTFFGKRDHQTQLGRFCLSWTCPCMLSYSSGLAQRKKLLEVDEVGRVREEKRNRDKIREETEKKKEDTGARECRKVAIHCVFSNDLWLWSVGM